MQSQLSNAKVPQSATPLSAEDHPWVETALAHWNGGTILQIGLAHPGIAVELSRRGACVVGVDRDAARVEGARRAAAAAGGRARFEAGAYETLHSWNANEIDVVIFETLPTGAEITLALEAALAVAPRVVVPAREQSRLPDRFAVLAKDTNPGVNGGLVALSCYVLSETQAAPAHPCFNARLVGDDSHLSHGERGADEGFVAVLERCVAPGAGEAVSIVRDRRLRPGEPDAAAVATRDPQCVASVVATATRTDRFSREHVAVLRGFPQIWVPCAFQRMVAIQSGLDRDAVRVVPDAVDTNRFVPRAKRAGDFRILAMASGPHRVEEALLAARAFSEELADEPTARLTILCGAGVDSRDVESRLERVLANPNNVPAARIEVIDAVPREMMESWYPRFDLFLRPSSGERRAIAILESMACGVPVAATRFGLAAELVHTGNGYPIEIEGLRPCDPTRPGASIDEAGHLQPVPSLASVRGAIRAAFDDADARAERASVAREQATLGHSPEAVAARIPFDGFALALAGSHAPLSEPVEESQLSEAAGDLGGLVHFDGGDGLPPAVGSLETGLAAREVWCSTPLSRQAWISAGVPPRRVHVPPPAIDTERFHPKVRPAVVPTRKRFRILTSAVGDFMAGPDLAVRVFAESKLSQAALLVMGAKPETQRLLKRLADSIAPEMEVVFVAEPADPLARASLVAACDLWLDCSRVGSDGTSILEAAACAKPALACPLTLPEGILSTRTGYPLPARPRALTLDGNTTVLFEVWVSDSAALLRRAHDENASRRARGNAAVELAQHFSRGRFAAWVAGRRSAILSAEGSPTIELVAPASSVLPNISPETTVHRLRGERVRGGQAGEANDLAHALESDFVVFVSGSLEGEPRWVERAVEPLRDDPKRSVAIAKDDRGALLAVRTSVLRKLSFSEDFASGAYLVDFARQAIQAGTLAAPLANLGIRFVATDPRFAEEAHAVELLSAAQESFASSQLEPGLESLQAALVAHPRYGAAFRTVSHFFEAAALPGELRGALEALVKLDPRDAVAHAQLGDLFEKLGSRERALAHLRVAHELAPEQPKLANLYADALRAAGRAREAAEVYLESLHAAPDGLQAAIGMAEALAQLGQAQDALELLQSFEIAPVRKEVPVAVH